MKKRLMIKLASFSRCDGHLDVDYDIKMHNRFCYAMRNNLAFRIITTFSLFSHKSFRYIYKIRHIDKNCSIEI